MGIIQCHLKVDFNIFKLNPLFIWNVINNEVKNSDEILKPESVAQLKTSGHYMITANCKKTSHISTNPLQTLIIIQTWVE